MNNRVVSNSTRGLAVDLVRMYRIIPYNSLYDTRNKVGTANVHSRTLALHVTLSLYCFHHLPMKILPGGKLSLDGDWCIIPEDREWY